MSEFSARYAALTLSLLKPSWIQKLVSFLHDGHAISELLEPDANLDLSPPILAAVRELLVDFESRGKELEEQAHRVGLSIVTFEESDFPPQLREIPDPPLALYYKGTLPDYTRHFISIVGARNSDGYGNGVAYNFAYSLAKLGVVIVSGMAAGIDGAAHRGALDAGGETLAVLGTGADQIYPKAHKKLYERILSSGAVLSEFLPGEVGFPANFPRRNRIIAALSKAVVVVQAAKRSGSLSTANRAVMYSRELFAVPGSVFNPLSKGVNSLLKDGALLAESAEDIISYLGMKTSNSEAAPLELSDEERTVYSLLDGTLSASVLADRMSMPASRFFAILSSLEVRGYIRQEQGGIYIPLH